MNHQWSVNYLLTDKVYMHRTTRRVSWLTGRTSPKRTSTSTRLWWFF